MKAIILGTGTSQGIPVIGCQCSTCKSVDPKDKRLRCSILIIVNGIHIVIDAGPDFRQQMLSYKNERLDALLITHEHNDHIIGMDDIRPYVFNQDAAIDVYALPRVSTEIKTKFHYAFDNPYPGAPKINLYNIDQEKDFFLGSTKITPIPILHGRLDIVGYRIANFAYITDASFISESSFELLENVDTLIINSLREKKHLSHFNLEETLEAINRIKPKQAYLTHLSHLFPVHSELEESLPEHVHLAYDGLILEI